MSEDSSDRVRRWREKNRAKHLQRQRAYNRKWYMSRKDATWFIRKGARKRWQEVDAFRAAVFCACGWEVRLA